MGREVCFFGRRGKLLPHAWVTPWSNPSKPTEYRGGRRNRVTDKDKENAAVVAEKVNNSFTHRALNFLSGLFLRKDFSRRRAI